jgi:hypothetical protein
VNQHEANRAIYLRWIAVWPTLTATSYVFDNNLAEESVPYARVSIQDLASSQHTMGAGARKWERTGIVWVKLSAPAGQGRGAVDQLVDHVRTVLEGARFGGPAAPEDGVVCAATSCDPAVNDGRLWILATTTPFYYYQRR